MTQLGLGLHFDSRQHRRATLKQRLNNELQFVKALNSNLVGMLSDSLKVLKLIAGESSWAVKEIDGKSEIFWVGEGDHPQELAEATLKKLKATKDSVEEKTK